MSLPRMTTTIAGYPGGTLQTGFLDGGSSESRFWLPMGITTDGVNLFVADALNHAIRRIEIGTGVVTTVAGTGNIGAADGTGQFASFSFPHGITTDGSNLYVSDSGNNCIREIR